MSNFKSGSGNLDFGGGNSDDTDEDEETSAPSETSQSPKSERETTPTPSDQSTSSSADSDSSEIGNTSETPSSTHVTTDDSMGSKSMSAEYPYFIRRNNVGDERDTRLEIHVRDKVADQEAAFRNELADQLGTNDISKTDAREFALLAAFRHPERVAELMQDEGFGTL